MRQFPDYSVKCDNDSDLLDDGYVARITNPQAHCLHSATAPLGTLVTGCRVQECLKIIVRDSLTLKRTHLHTFKKGVILDF